ncbi:MAG: hypothetical protein PHG14_11160 [Desulfobacter postgatei]|uniref:hypothetical protein n=1 Tax=Desulfobacter postgatei TaxID=2293 RepID=UPI0023F1A87E|nr:hypothetical protein [Desulfobacter postgatei]MDD4274272.1 hypothetical protein [Desulfobacter postgatei]
MKNQKSKAALEAYTEKVRSGEVEKPVTLTPIEKARQNPKSLRAAINGKCFDCCCGNRAEVSRCQITSCTLHPVRPWQRT